MSGAWIQFKARREQSASHGLDQSLWAHHQRKLNHNLNTLLGFKLRLCFGAASSFGERFGSAGTTCAGNVHARAEVVMLADAFPANVELMHSAVNYGRLRPAQIATSANGSGLGFGRFGSCTLQ